MSASDILSVVSLVISLVSLLTAARLAVRQSALMRHANELPIFIELTQEFRSPDFQHAEEYVLRKLATEHSPDLGISNLPEDAKVAVSTVLTFFSTFGAYIAFGLADEKIVISIFGYRANRAWVALEPYILGERKLRNDDYHAGYFEDLICRVRDNWPPLVKYKLEVRRLDDEGKKWRENPVLIDKLRKKNDSASWRRRYPPKLRRE
jgi:hypothetical protein